MPVRRSRSTTRAACSRTLTAGAWMWCSDTSSTVLGSSALAASAANCSSPIPISTSGSNVANRSSSPTARGCRRLSAASRRSKVPATCLKALYCSSRAKSRSRASSSARSSSSSTSPCGSSRAALRSRRVEAMSRNDVVCSRSQTGSAGLHEGDELVGDRGQRHLGDVQLVLGDQAQQQVERALEVVQPHRERGRSRRSGATASASLTPRSAAGPGRSRRRAPRSRPARARGPRGPGGPGRPPARARRAAGAAPARGGAARRR